MSESLIGSAYVDIKPNPASIKAFPGKVRADLQAALARSSFKITVTPTIGPFKSKIQSELRASKFSVAVSPILIPDFRAQLEAQVAKATAGMKVPITFIPAGAGVPTGGTGKGRGGTGGGTGGRGGTSQAALQQRLVVLTEARAVAEESLSRAQAQGISTEERKRLADVALQKSQVAVNRTIGEGVSAQRVKSKTFAASVAEERRLAEELQKRAVSERSAAKSALAAEEADKKRAVSAEAVTSAEATRAKLATKLAAADQAGALATGEVAAAKAVLAAKTKVLAGVEKLYDKAVELENPTLIENVGLLHQKAVAEELAAKEAVKTALADKAAAAAASQRATAQALASRGFLATALAGLGARGATLAASFEFLAGAAIATGVFKSLKAFASLEQELNTFQQVAQATDEQMKEVSATAQALGVDMTLPAVSAGDAASAMTALAKAGLSVEDSMAAARGVLQLATAAQIDNAEATELVASGLNAFGLGGREAVRVADLLTGSANESQGSIADMGVALQQSAAVARQAGFTIEDTIALLTLLARNGLKGSDAGTSLRTSLIRLINPTQKAKDRLADLDVTIRNASGAIRPEVYADLEQAMAGMTAKQRDATRAILFGQDAIRAQAILGREGAAGLNAMRDATQRHGLAADAAAARTKGLSGEVEGLKNEAEGLGVSLGKSLAPLAELAIKAIEPWLKITTTISDTIFAVEEFGGSILDQTQKVGVFLDEVTAGVPVVNRFFTSMKATGEKSEAEAIASDIDDLIKKIPLGTSNMGDLQKKTGEAKRIMEELGDAAPDELVAAVKAADKALAGTTQRLRDDLSPQLKLTTVDMYGFSNSLADAGSRANALNAEIKVTPYLLDAMSDAGSRQAAIQKTLAERDAYTSSLDTQIALAQAANDRQRELALLREKEAKQEAHLQRMRERYKQAPGPNLDKGVKNAAQALAETRGQIQQIEEEIAREGEQAADDIAKARNEADRKFLDALGLRRNKKENAVLRAQATASLQDDIAAHKALRQFLINSRKQARETLKDAKTRAEAVSSLTTDIIQENNTIIDLQRQLVSSISEKFETKINIAEITGTVSQIRRLYAAYLKELKAALKEAKKGSKAAQELQLQILETQRSAFDAINESFELDISFAQASDNKKKEINARKAYIAQLQREQAQYKRGTLEWKRIRNAIAEQKQAIKDARGEMRDLFHEMSFEFLTRQQGFAATVMSNLLGPNLVLGAVGGVSKPGSTRPTPPTASSKIDIPRGAAIPTSGTGVGVLPKGGRSPSTQLGYQTADALAGARGGTPSQFSAIIHLLQQMVTLLAHQEARGKHPNNRASRGAGGAALDTM